MLLNPNTFSLQDLVDQTGIEGRTIRHYISIGLLPAPISKGRDARYSQVHLKRLKQILILKRRFKLDEIRILFQEQSESDLEQMLQALPTEPDNLALHYLDSIAGRFSQTSRAPLSESRRTGKTGMSPPQNPDPLGLNEEIAPIDQLLARLQPEERAAHIPSRSSQNWQVIEIIPGIELHIREPSRLLQARLERACDYIRYLLSGSHHGR